MYYLINLYEGRVQHAFSTEDEIREYLKRKGEQGTLMGPGAYTVAEGIMLSIENYYPKDAEVASNGS